MKPINLDDDSDDGTGAAGLTVYNETEPVERAQQAVIDLATQAAAPVSVPDGEVTALTVPAGGSVVLVNRDRPENRSFPDRAKGTTTLHDAASFVAFGRKHQLPQTDYFADLRSNRVVAVFNANEAVSTYTVPDATDPSKDTEERGEAEGTAGWSDHRATLLLSHTVAWQTWMKFNGQMLSQHDFAELVEGRLVDFLAESGSPSAADMLELAQTFEATSNVAFKTVDVLANGRRGLNYEVEQTTRAGERGQIEIPKGFTLAVAPFEGGEPYKQPARFRYRIVGQALQLGYVLDRPEDTLKDAFLGIVETIEQGVDRTVMRGVPA